ncbi:MAG TPA: LytTR family DNA-binding domain-containing protein [Chitinophaga sp.]|uniref:LytR/AlgR family response regulator transcription factor n=1 Tax=Chitinophaga sp. TaxID=1869181 RepID=UPI002BA77686|nr:LytTR family DNA-binding domain-containing protein [Chitinophaga sp.]HVI45786.1 LytTR family DNA-binding domain-containing protein [Chitinophaga sp.]
MRILIIEDELHNAKRLSRLLEEVEPGIEIQAILEGVEETVTWLDENAHPDLMFLDVRLNDGLSFDIFAKTRVNCPVIFTSAFDEYALRAFKVNSVDYLLKPVNKNELKQSLEKFKVNLKAPFLSATLMELSAILTKQKKNYRSRFLLPVRDAYHTLSVEEVSYFVTEYRSTKAITDRNGTFIIPYTLEDLEEQLNPDAFFRINRQYLVSNKAISRIHNYFNGKLTITVHPETTEKLIVSKDRARSLKKWLDR